MRSKEGPRKRVFCPLCGFEVAIYPTGRLYRHLIPHEGFCRGSGRYPGALTLDDALEDALEEFTRASRERSEELGRAS